MFNWLVVGSLFYSKRREVVIVWKEKLLQYICVLAYDVHIKCV